MEETSLVYLGKHVLLPRQAAVKVMHPGNGYDGKHFAMQMLKEACMLEALDHPGIPRVYECGVLPDRRAWTAIERIEGDSIGAAIAAAPMSAADVVTIIRDVADVLDHIHRRGIVHRKVTPDALVRTPHRRSAITLRYWGAACASDAEGKTNLDLRDDIRDLGITAFLALTGADPVSVATLVGRGPDTPMHVRYPGTPLDVAALIDGLYAADPSRRPTAAEARDRAAALVDRVDRMAVGTGLTAAGPRYTPSHELASSLPPDAAPRPAMPRTATRDASTARTATQDVSGFSIRIAGRTPTRG